MTSSKINHSTKYVSPFAKKMKTVAVGILICGGLIGAPIIWSSAGKPLLPIMFAAARAIEIIVWLYLSAILFQFYRRTQLREYVLHIHTFWLAGVIAFPFSYLFGGILFLFRNAMQPNLYTFFGFAISATWLILLLIGKALCKRRVKQMDTEIQSNTAIWKRLLGMDLKSIALLQFPINR